MKRRTPLTYEEALAKIEGACACTEQCCSDVKRRLRRWGVGAADIERITETLVDRHFVDDMRYAAAVVHDKVMLSHWGRRRAEMWLRVRDIPQRYIDDAMEEIDEEEYQRNLLDLLCKRRRLDGIANDMKGRAKLYRIGVGRGYESSLVSEYLRYPEVWGLDTESLD